MKVAKFFGCMISGVLLVGILVVIFIVNLDDFLAVDDKLREADAIVVISGGGTERLEKGIELYKQGLAPILIFSGAAKDIDSPSNASAMRSLAVSVGVKANDIVIEEKALNTYQNAVYTFDIVRERNFSKIILVTSYYHQRRAYLTFKNVYSDKAEIMNAPAFLSGSGRWWRNEVSKKLVMNEFGKLVWIWLTGDLGNR